MSTYAYRQAAGIRQALLDRRELALIDVREEADFATAHPLFAVNLPLSKLELEVRRRIPRFTTPLTVYDNGEGLAEIAVERLRAWGYQDVALLAEGLAGWRRSGGELFQDVNSASKAFGELVESVRHTPSLSAQEVQALIDSRQEVVIVDARRFDEYQTMSIPGSISVPGGELALRVESLTPSPADAGYRQLRRTHPQHHWHPVADQRRRAKPGPCPAQWHYRLDAGRPDAGAPATAAIRSLLPRLRRPGR